jgi:hypothetical protein
MRSCRQFEVVDTDAFITSNRTAALELTHCQGRFAAPVRERDAWTARLRTKRDEIILGYAVRALHASAIAETVPRILARIALSTYSRP